MTNGDEQAGGKLYPVAVDLETKRIVAVGEAVSAGDHAGRAAAMQGLADRVAGLPVPVTRVTEVTEVVGYQAYDYEGVGTVIAADGPRSLSLIDLLPDGVEGKRGRFKVTVEFTPEADEGAADDGDRSGT